MSDILRQLGLQFTIFINYQIEKLMSEIKSPAEIAAEKEYPILPETGPDRSTIEMFRDIFIKGYNAKPSLKWKKIDINNLPEEECLAFSEHHNSIGITRKFVKTDVSITGVASNRMWDCTHYIPLSDLLTIEKE